MKIKHIYITKEGEPMANPYLYPVEPFYESGLLPFEDITLFKAATWGKGPFVFLPSTLISVDLEVEVVVDAETGKLFLRIKPFRELLAIAKEYLYGNGHK